MVFKSRIWISTALALLLSFLFWFYFGTRVEASSSGPYSVTYEGVDFYFYKGDFNLSCKSNDVGISSYSFVFEDPDNTVTFFYDTGSYKNYWIWHTGSVVSGGTKTEYMSNGNKYVSELTNNMDSGYSDPWFAHISNSSSFVKYGDFGLSASAYRNLAKQFVASDEYANVRMPVSVQVASSTSDNFFALNNVKGYVEEDVFYSSWNVPFGVGEDSREMPLLVDFQVTDLDLDTYTEILYPASELPDTMRITFFDVKDKSLSIDLSKVEGLPVNYRIDFVKLTPYYYDTDIISLTDFSLRKGQTSLIYLDYTGKHENTIQVLPDDIIVEEDTDKSIMGMISNFFSSFFNNLLDALKRAFVPSSDDLWSLLNDMNDWFSERLGFIWYPFDLAYQIVEVFLTGDANNVIKVPAMTFNMLGGITIYEGGEFEIDQIGIFEYVKFLTSAIIACSVARLAKVKWDEWITGQGSVSNVDGGI